MEVREASEMEVDDTLGDNQTPPNSAVPEAGAEATMTTEEPGQDRPPPQGLTEEMIVLRDEKKMNLINMINRVQETFNGLDRYAMQLTKMKEEHLQHLTQLQDMEDYHKEMLRRLQSEHDRLIDLQGEIGVVQANNQGGGGGGGGGDGGAGEGGDGGGDNQQA